MTHNYHENYNIVVKEFNELMRKCYTRSSVSIHNKPWISLYMLPNVDGVYIKMDYDEWAVMS